MPVGRSLFINIVETSELMGFRVRPLVSDMGSVNQKLIPIYEFNQAARNLKNPFYENENIWTFCNGPHTLKVYTNHFFGKGYEFLDGKMLKKKIVKKRIKSNNNSHSNNNKNQ